MGLRQQSWIPCRMPSFLQTFLLYPSSLNYLPHFLPFHWLPLSLEFTQRAREEMHILLVEDNLVHQKVATKLLQNIGCTVAIAGDGQQALNYLAAPPAACPRPDMILMDLAMPVMDGLEATHIIRTQLPFTADPKISMTPIVGLCTTALPSDHRKYMEQGMDDVITKPFRKGHLKRVLLYWSRRQLMPRRLGVMLPQSVPVQRWGVLSPLRMYRGPRSLL